MQFNVPFYDRVYLHMGEDFDTIDFSGREIDKMIECVAKSNPIVNEVVLYDPNNRGGFVYVGRTRQFIVDRVEEFIEGIKEEFSDEVNIARHASLNQLKKLSKTHRTNKKMISCHSFIYLYVMFQLIGPEIDEVPEIHDIGLKLEKLVYLYYEQLQDDKKAENKLVEYMLKTIAPILTAISKNDKKMDRTKLPAIERRCPRRRVDG